MVDWTETQIEWLKKAKAKDISRVFAKKDLDFSDKIKIQKRWLEIHQSKKQNELSDSWLNPEAWR